MHRQLRHGVERSGGAEAPADLVVLDANVLTIVDASPQAEAFAVRDGRFVAVGKSSDMERYIGPKTQILHLKGKTVTPGFNDCAPPSFGGLCRGRPAIRGAPWPGPRQDDG